LKKQTARNKRTKKSSAEVTTLEIIKEVDQ
jgi:hypothetical protein